MFTGLIQDIGTIINVVPSGGGRHLSVRSAALARQLAISDSVAINGVCQTVVKSHGDLFEVIAVEETLKKTTFGDLHVSQRVNLELPLRLNDRLGGHLLQGHVDLATTICSIRKLETGILFGVEIPPAYIHYIVPTGSIAIDGVSLTVAELLESSIRVAIIPHTMEKTIFQYYKSGDRVNIEFDVIGKYVERLLGKGRASGSSSEEPWLRLDDLRESGF